MSTPPVAAVQQALARHGWRGELRVFDEPVPTAAAAAATLGCDVAAIANSLVFEVDGEALLVLASGAHRVDTAGLAARLGTGRIRRASPEFVLAHTGQPVGGVAPVGHPRRLRTVVDQALAAQPVLWAGAGDPHAMFSTTFEELIALTGGTPAPVAASRGAGMAEPDLPLTGGCGCGAVRFEVTAPLGPASWCHCTRCQRRTGGPASAQARTQPGSFRIAVGEEHVRLWSPEGGFHKAFCGLCGSALFSRSPDDPELIGVRLGAFDRDPGVRPQWRAFVAYAAPWYPLPDDGLPRYPEARPA